MGKRTLSSRKKEKKQVVVTKVLWKEAIDFVMTIYLFAVFVVMPLYIYDHYYEMAFYKWKIYLFATLALVGIVLISGLVYGIVKMRKQTPVIKRQVCATDILVIFYGISVFITLFSCGYPRAAWLGTDSWYMGALAQLLFVGTYLIFSRVEVPVSKVIWMNLIASMLCFVIGIAQRYGWDFLHLYYGMPAEVIRDYLSTVGNRTWYSGYISVVFPIGVYLFWQGGSRKQKWLTGIYSFVAFGAIVTNNSDSIYLAVMAVLFALFVMSIGSLDKLCRWLYIVVLWFAACGAMALLRVLHPEDVRLLRGLSEFFMNVKTVIIGLLLTLSLLFVLNYLKKKHKKTAECSQVVRKRLQTGCIVSAALLATLVISVVVFNTTGMLQKWFGLTIHNNYFLFNDSWGDARGFNWKFTLQMFRELPLVQKLFGVGSDCYAIYAYSNPDYAQVLFDFWGQETMAANAHNEWLNALLCHGVVGSILYIGIFISVMLKCFYQNDSIHAKPFASAIGLCVLGYMTHNVFCYQQICATGPMFLLMGVATQSMRRRENDES